MEIRRFPFNCNEGWSLRRTLGDVEQATANRGYGEQGFEYARKNDKKITNYRFWQEGNNSQEIYLYDYFNQKLNYIHENPVKAEIVNREEDYRFIDLTVQWNHLISY